MIKMVKGWGGGWLRKSATFLCAFSHFSHRTRYYEGNLFIISSILTITILTFISLQRPFGTFIYFLYPHLQQTFMLSFYLTLYSAHAPSSFTLLLLLTLPRGLPSLCMFLPPLTLHMQIISFVALFVVLVGVCSAIPAKNIEQFVLGFADGIEVYTFFLRDSSCPTHLTHTCNCSIRPLIHTTPNCTNAYKNICGDRLR